MTRYVVSGLILVVLVMGLGSMSVAEDVSTQDRSEQLLNLDFQDVDIREVLRAIGLQQGVNVVADPDVTGPVTIRLERVTAAEGLRLLAASYGWVVERHDSGYRLRQSIESTPLRVERINDQVNVIASGASVESIVLAVARHAGVSLAISHDVTDVAAQPITIYLHELPPRRALDLVLHAAGLQASQEDDTLFIEKLGTVAFQDETDALLRDLPEGFGRLTLTDGLLDAEIRNVPVGSFLKELADRFDPGDGLVPVFADRDVSSLAVTGAVFQMPFEEALAALLAPYGLRLTEVGSGYRIAQESEPLPYTLSYVDGLLTVKADGAALSDLLRDVASITSVTLLLPPGMSQRVTIDLQPMRPADAVPLLLEEFGYRLERDDRTTGQSVEFVSEEGWQGVYRVIPPDTRPVRVSVTNGLFAVEAVDARLSSILQEISRVSGENIVLAPGPDPTITVTLRDLALPDLLTALLARDEGHVEQHESYVLVRLPQAESVRRTVDLQRFIMPEGIVRLDVEADEIDAEFYDVPLQHLIEAVVRAGGPALRADPTILNDRLSGVVQGVFDVAWSRYLIDEGYRTLPLASGLLVHSGRTNEPIIHYETTDDGQGLFYLDVSGMELATVIREMALKAGRNIIVYSHVRANLNHVRLYGVSFEEGLQQLLRGTTFSVVDREGTYLVGEGVTPRFDSRDMMTSKTIALHHISAQHVINMLPASLPSQNVRPLPDGWGLVITGNRDLIEGIESFVATVDRPTQVEPILLPLRYADGAEIAPLVARQFPPEVFQFLESQNAFLLQGTVGVNERIRTYIAALDQPGMATRTVIHPLQHVMAEEAKAHLPPHFDGSRVLVIPDQNALVLTGREEILRAMRQYLDGIDVRNPQIQFDVMIVEITDRQRSQFGMSGATEDGVLKFDLLGGSPLTWNIGSARGGGSLVATLSTLVQEGQANLLANPRITTLSGREASFNVLTTNRFWSPQTDVDDDPDSGSNVIPVFRTIETGIRLRLLPWISASGEITIELSPEISDSDRSSGGSSLPSTNDRSVQTTVRVRDGETFVIGGLIQRSEQVDVAKVPILGDLPIFGRLFRSENRGEIETEFVIAITSHLVDFPNRMSESGGGSHEVEN